MQIVSNLVWPDPWSKARSGHARLDCKGASTNSFFHIITCDTPPHSVMAFSKWQVSKEMFHKWQ